MSNDSTNISTSINDTEHPSRQWDVTITEWESQCELIVSLYVNTCQLLLKHRKCAAENGASPNALFHLDQEQIALDKQDIILLGKMSTLIQARLM